MGSILIEPLINTAHAAMRMTTPILYAAMGGLIAEHAGVINIGIEGMMLAGAFVGLLGAWIGGSSLWGVVMAALAGVLLGVLFALLVVHLDANAVVVGLGLNIFVLGVTSYVMQVYFKARGSFTPEGVVALPHWSLGPVRDIPVLGSVLSGHTPVVYGSALAVVFTWVMLYRTRFGLRLRSIGEEPGVARAMGVPVRRIQVGALVICGVLSGIGGAQLSIGDLTRFTENMTNGRGFIALAAYFFGQKQPIMTTVASVIFGFFQSLQIRLQTYGIPPQLVQSLPYLVVVGALGLIAYRKRLNRRRRQKRAVPEDAGDAPDH